MPLTGPEIRVMVGQCFDEANAEALKDPKQTRALKDLRERLVGSFVTVAEVKTQHCRLTRSE